MCSLDFLKIVLWSSSVALGELAEALPLHKDVCNPPPPTASQEIQNQTYIIASSWFLLVVWGWVFFCLNPFLLLWKCTHEKGLSCSAWYSPEACGVLLRTRTDLFRTELQWSGCTCGTFTWGTFTWEVCLRERLPPVFCTCHDAERFLDPNFSRRRIFSLHLAFSFLLSPSSRFGSDGQKKKTYFQATCYIYNQVTWQPDHYLSTLH